MAISFAVAYLADLMWKN